MSLILQHALLLASLAQVSVNLAPDQPIAQVYADELLVVEFLAQDDTEFSADMTLTRAGAEPVTVNFGTLSVRAGSPRWVMVSDVPWQRGLYHARVETRVRHDVAVTEKTFCRVDRPVAGSRLPVSVSVDDLSRDTILRLRSLSAEAVSIDGMHPDVYALVETSTKAGFHVRIRLNPDELSATGGDPIALVNQIGNAVALWELASGENAGPPIALARAIRSRAPTARLALRLGHPEHLGTLLAEGAGIYFDTITVDAKDPELRVLEAFRREAERAGYEGLTFEQRLEETDSATPLISPVESLRKGYDRALLATAAFLTGGELGEGYCYASTLAQRLGSVDFLGDVALDDNTVGQLFVAPRHESQANEWTFFIPQSEEPALHLAPGDAQELRLFDALNNTMRLEPSEDGTVSFSTAEGPAMLCGVGGTLPREAACASIRHEAQAVLELDGVDEHLGSDRSELLKAFAACDGTTPGRLAGPTGKLPGVSLPSVFRGFAVGDSPIVAGATLPPGVEHEALGVDRCFRRAGVVGCAGGELGTG